MKTLILIMIATVLFCSGFTWGKSKEQACLDANQLIYSQQMKSPDSLPDDLERKVVGLCPGGAGYNFLEGLKHELRNQIDGAIQSYERAITIDEHFSYAHGRLGLLQLKQNNRPAGMVSLTRALEEGGKNPIYHLALAELLLETQTYPLALYHYEKSNILGKPYTADSLASMAKTYSGMKNWKNAENSIRQAILLSPNEPKLKSELARIVIRQQRPREGIELLKQAIALKPDEKSIHRELADVLNATGDLEGAKAELQLAGFTVVNAAVSLVQQGDTHLLHRDFPAAIKCYKDAVDKNASPAIYQKLGDAYLAIGNDDDALNSYQKSLSISPEDADVHYSAGVILERKGDIDRAVVEYERSISLDKNNGDAHRRLAEIYALKGDLKNAINEYNKILAKAPENPVIHFKLAKIYLRFGKSSFDDAKYSLEKAIKLDSMNFEPRRELVKLEIKRGNLTRAEELCKEMLVINRDDQQERKRLVGILGTQKKYKDLAKFLTEESTLYPGDSMNHYRLGIVEMYLHNNQAAIQAFQKSIKIRPTVQSYHALARVYLSVSEKIKAREAVAEANKLDPKKQDIRELVEIIDEELGNAKTDTAKKHTSKKKKSTQGH